MPDQSATQPAAAPVAADDAADTGPACRHCGQPKPEGVDTATTPDWLCTACERYQDAWTCPTCGGPARISALPENMRPPVATAKRRAASKAKE